MLSYKGGGIMPGCFMTTLHCETSSQEGHWLQTGLLHQKLGPFPSVTGLLVKDL